MKNLNPFTVVFIGLLLAGRAIANDVHPLLKGSYEIYRVQEGDKAEAEVTSGPATKTSSWHRMMVKYDGSRVSLISQRLDFSAGAYVGCEASVTNDVVWSATGYTVPTKTDAEATVTHFQKLTHKDVKKVGQECSISMDPGTFVVVAGDQPKLKSNGVTITLRSASTDPDWSSHIP